MVPTKLPRRVIAGFVHKVPTAYLKLVTEMISYIDTGTPPPPGNQDQDPTTDMPSSSEPSLAHQLDPSFFQPQSINFYDNPSPPMSADRPSW